MCVGKVLEFYCDVKIKSRLQFINTLIDIFFSKLHTFLAEQSRKKKANDG